MKLRVDEAFVFKADFLARIGKAHCDGSHAEEDLRRKAKREGEFAFPILERHEESGDRPKQIKREENRQSNEFGGIAMKIDIGDDDGDIVINPIDIAEKGDRIPN